MTHIVRTIAAAAILIAANTAHAEWQFQSGTGTLTFGQAGRDAFDAAGSFIVPDDWIPAGNTHVSDEGDVVTLALTSATTAGDNVQSLTSTGSILYIERTVVVRGSTVLDNIITLSNFSFDLNTKTLSAEVAGTDLLSSLTTNYGLLPIFSATSLIGSNAISGGKIAFSTAGPLTIHSTTADTLLNFLDTSAFYPYHFAPVITNLWKNTDWGTFSGQAVLSAVPEPSAYLSVLAGMAVLGAMRARRQKSA